MGSTGSHSDWFSGMAAATTGLGILTFTFFPFAIPFLLLTAVALLPFALPLIAIGAIAAIVAGVRRAIQAAGRGARRLGTRGEREGATREVVTRAPVTLRLDHCHD